MFFGQRSGHCLLEPSLLFDSFLILGHVIEGVCRQGNGPVQIEIRDLHVSEIAPFLLSTAGNFGSDNAGAMQMTKPSPPRSCFTADFISLGRKYLLQGTLQL